MIRRLLTLCLLFPGTVNAQQPERIQLPKQLAQLNYQPVPLQRTAENHLYLVAKLDGRRRSVLVDTGWSFTTVSTNTARRLPAAREQAENQSPGVLIKNLRLGSVTFTNQPALVEHMVFNGQPASFDVVLGCDFLRRHFAIIDCRGRRLYVRDQEPTWLEQSTLATTLREGGFVAVTLKLKRPLAMTCPARVNGHPVEMLVDTGAVWSTLDARQLERLGLQALPTLAKISGAGATGTRAVAMAETKSFALGDVALKETNFALMDLGDWGFGTPGGQLSEVHGILGGTELVENGAVIDCHSLKLWVKPRAATRK